MNAQVAHVENVRLVHYCQLSATTIVIYDHLLTLGLEVEYIWNSRWSSSKILFLCNRYIGHLIILSLALVYFNPNPTPKFCAIGVIFIQWFTSAIVWTTQVILMYRIRAMFGGSRTVTNAIVGCFVVEVILMIWLVMANQLIFQGEAILAPAGNNICAITHVLSYKYAYWIPVIAFESLLFCLALYIFRKDLLAHRRLRPWSQVSLLNLLVRDNILYFFISLVTYTATLSVWLNAPPTWWQIPAYYSYNGTTILGCRLILNLSEAFYTQFPSARQASLWESHCIGNSATRQEDA